MTDQSGPDDSRPVDSRADTSRADIRSLGTCSDRDQISGAVLGGALVELLGPVAVVLPDGSRPPLRTRLQALLAALAIRMPHVVPVDQLVRDVWDVDTSPKARNRVHVHLSALRAVVGPDLLQTHGSGYRLDPERVTTDVACLDRRARAALDEADPARRSALLRAALDSVGDAPLGGLSAPYTVLAAQSLTDRVATVRRERVAADLAAGHHHDLLPELATEVAAHPLQEQACCQYVLALYRSQRQADALAALRRVRQQLREDEGVDPGPELQDLEMAVLRQDPRLSVPGSGWPGEQLSPGSGRTTPGGVPTAPVPLDLTPLLGRQQVVDDLASLLEDPDVRLVTVLGPGGVGKTRVARAVARRAVRPAWVSLDAVEDVDAVLPTIMTNVGLRVGVGDDLVGQLATALAGRVLVLDNVEQVLGTAPRLVELLQASPGLTVLVTSRMPLGVVGEVEQRLLPLPVTGDGAAVELFCQRSRDAGGRPGSSADDVRAVAALVRRLDGLPLAIELAAARSRVLSASEILARLDAGGLSDADPHRPRRHRSLEDTLEWSWRLLDRPEQELLTRLAAFTSGLPLAAVDALAGDTVPRPVDSLSTLVGASLVQPDPDRPHRYRLLETVRAFAAEKLDAHPEVQQIRAAHARWVGDRVADLSSVAQDRPGDTLPLLGDEGGNVEAALAWLIENGEVAPAARLLFDSRHHWRMNTSLLEVTWWLDRIGPDGALRIGGAVGARLCDLGAYLWLDREHLDRAAAWAEAGVTLTEQAPNEPWALHVSSSLLGLQGTLLQMQGDLDASVALLHRSLDIAESADSPRVEGQAVANLCLAAQLGGDHEAVLRYGQRMLDVTEQLGWLLPSLETLPMMALSLIELDRLEEATRLHDEVTRLARDIGSAVDQLDVILVRAGLRLASGDLDDTEQVCREGEQLACSIDQSSQHGRLLALRGAATVLRGGPAEGVRLVAAGERQQRRASTARMARPRAVADAVAVARSALGDDAVDRLLDGATSA